VHVIPTATGSKSQIKGQAAIHKSSCAAYHRVASISGELFSCKKNVGQITDQLLCNRVDRIWGASSFEQLRNTQMVFTPRSPMNRQETNLRSAL
jgi:hypothetical protein